MDKFVIPSQRENLNNNEFKKQLEQRKATKNQEKIEKYSELKFKIVHFCCTKGVFIAIVFWLVAYFFNHTEIKTIMQFYLQTLITLYIGSLISKDI